MKIKEANKILKTHNKWRRDPNVPSTIKMGDVEQLGIAIDVITEFIDILLKIKEL